MKIDTLKSRVENAKSKIDKKLATIDRKQRTIESKMAKIQAMGLNPNQDKLVFKDNPDAYWLKCDIENLMEDIARNKREIEETRRSLEKYEAQLSGELEKEAILLKEIPESMKRLQTELVDKWDECDRKRRDCIIADRKALSYKEFSTKYSLYESQLVYRTDEQIHNDNLQESKIFILDLYYRIRNITGEVINWSNIHLDYGNVFPVLTGYVEGKEGRCLVETITAGGYNIQRLHVRTLVKEIQ